MDNQTKPLTKTQLRRQAKYWVINHLEAAGLWSDDQGSDITFGNSNQPDYELWFRPSHMSVEWFFSGLTGQENPTLQAWYENIAEECNAFLKAHCQKYNL